MHYFLYNAKNTNMLFVAVWAPIHHIWRKHSMNQLVRRKCKSSDDFNTHLYGQAFSWSLCKSVCRCKIFVWVKVLHCILGYNDFVYFVRQNNLTTCKVCMHVLCSFCSKRYHIIHNSEIEGKVLKPICV